jgi:hypothetical protein
VEVPKFSKFQHGMAMMFPALVRHTPSWFLPTASAVKPVSNGGPAVVSNNRNTEEAAGGGGSGSEGGSSGSPHERGSAASDDPIARAALAGGGPHSAAACHARSISATNLPTLAAVPAVGAASAAPVVVMRPASIDEVAEALAADEPTVGLSALTSIQHVTLPCRVHAIWSQSLRACHGCCVAFIFGVHLNRTQCATGCSLETSQLISGLMCAPQPAAPNSAAATRTTHVQPVLRWLR